MLASVLYFLKVHIPGIGLDEKIKYIKARSEYRLVRQQDISIAQEFIHRGRFRGGFAVLCIVLAVIAWCTVFTLGKSLSAAPFQLLVNVVSSRIASAPADRPLPSSPPLFWAMRGMAAVSPSNAGAALPLPDGEETSPPAAARSAASFPAADPTAVSGPLDIDRVTNFISYFGLDAEWQHLVVAGVISLLTMLYTNMLILACLASLIGSMCNYAVQALKQSREYANQAVISQAEIEHSTKGGVAAPHRTPYQSSMYGHRRVFSSLSATVVTGISLGFVAFLACTAGLLVFQQVMDLNSPGGYQRAVCFASLIAFLVALFPDGALLFIENRVNNATQLAKTAKQQGATHPGSNPSGASASTIGSIPYYSGDGELGEGVEPKPFRTDAVAQLMRAAIRALNAVAASTTRRNSPETKTTSSEDRTPL